MNTLLTAGLLAASSIAIAQTSFETGRNDPIAIPNVTERLARDIAWSAGVVHVDEIVLLDDRWEVAGRNRSGDELALDIDARDGSLLGQPQGLPQARPRGLRRMDGASAAR